MVLSLVGDVAASTWVYRVELKSMQAFVDRNELRRGSETCAVKLGCFA